MTPGSDPVCVCPQWSGDTPRCFPHGARSLSDPRTRRPHQGDGVVTCAQGLARFALAV